MKSAWNGTFDQGGGSLSKGGGTISSQVPSTTQPPFRDSVSFENLVASRTWQAQLQRFNRAAPTNGLIQPASLPRPQAQSASAPSTDRKTLRPPFPARRNAFRPRTVDHTQSRDTEKKASEVRASENRQDSSACPVHGSALSGRSISDGTFNGTDS